MDTIPDKYMGAWHIAVYRGGNRYDVLLHNNAGSLADTIVGRICALPGDRLLCVLNYISEEVHSKACAWAADAERRGVISDKLSLDEILAVQVPSLKASPGLSQ